MNFVEFAPPKMGYFYSESIKSLRSNIQFCGTDIKAIAFTSCLPNEGKTTVSAELARSLAEVGKKVLLIDADMRNSAMIENYNLPIKQRIGLSQYLSGMAGMDDILFSTSTEGLYIILSGPFPPNPAELLAGSSFKTLINEAKSLFDYVIIDTPPLGLVVDAAIIANICKNAVMVIADSRVKYTFANEVRLQLERAGAHVLGAIYNQTDNKKSSEKYGKYSRYYRRTESSQSKKSDEKISKIKNIVSPKIADFFKKIDEGDNAPQGKKDKNKKKKK